MSSRPPPATGNPPAYGAVARAYQSSLRPVVLVLSLITAIWSLIWYINLFRDINVDKDHGQPKLATLAIALGSLYISVTAIETFGIVAAATQRLALVRIYSIAAIVSSLLVIGAGFVRTITHFTLKSALIDECTEISTGGDIIFRFGIWGPTVRDHLDAAEAAQFCKNAWSHDSANEIISLIVEIVLAGFFCAIAWSYYKQLLDPNFGRQKVRAPSQQFENSYPQHYNPPYLAYSAPSGTFAPPPGPPPLHAGGYAPSYAPAYDGSMKPPGYEGPGIAGYGENKDDKDDPFADFETVKKNGHGESRDALV
ncbi:hypothetical protein QCA50_013418 [Cerrena zonata]|uniref:Transmembrane protein n=1 Tax=Cerrena zonata TaxID=2478898 RepID=A0AAW0FQK5_9APHY